MVHGASIKRIGLPARRRRSQVLGVRGDPRIEGEHPISGAAPDVLYNFNGVLIFALSATSGLEHWSVLTACSTRNRDGTLEIREGRTTSGWRG